MSGQRRMMVMLPSLMDNQSYPRQDPITALGCSFSDGLNYCEGSPLHRGAAAANYCEGKTQHTSGDHDKADQSYVHLKWENAPSGFNNTGLCRPGYITTTQRGGAKS
ncbi:unnamed protein product [Pleuronectes platessa]|uniref:Uncharacterized protein n=1 Tax=Pleuronectes platessa TaxID=8262 RepID=A0A9N7YUJ3_PLEPL|nr:unnamed protein product [Pleuronectes platessa]